VWSAAEYDKLRDYDAPTYAQPTAAFSCHATPEHLCNGWAVVGGYDLLAIRLLELRGPVAIPAESVPLFATGNEAADHGQRDIDNPSPEACAAVERLMGKYDRLSQ
jgi:hypothetical protein